jgi:hypothetical protein
MNRLLLLIVTIFLSYSASAQYNWEIGGRAGVANYLGEIGGGEGTARPWLMDMKIESTRWTFGGFTRYRFTPRWSAGAFLNYARIDGNDNNSLNPARRGRNLSFTNDMLELALRADFAIYNNYDVGNKGYYNPDFKIYLFAGAGGVLSNPKAKYEGETYNLRKLTTEGVAYSPIQFVMPTGVGAFFTFDRVHRFGMEVQYTWAFTDYLDDVSDKYVDPESLPSQIAVTLANRNPEFVPSNPEDIVPNANNYTPGNKRGDPSKYDGYMIISFSYSYVLRGKSTFYKRGQYNFLHRKNKKRRKSRAKF